MARSAAAKKVAKAASTGAGGKGAGRERNLLFPAAMAVVVVLGIVLIVMARGQRADNAPRGAPTLQDHWHAAYNIFVCDEISPTVWPDDSVNDETGIHTHGDGRIHIHPFVSTVSAQFATIGAFMDESELVFDDDSLQLPNGVVLSEDEAPCGGDEGSRAELRVLKWNTLDAETPIVYTEGLRDVRFNENGQLIVFAMVDPDLPDADIPRPDDTGLRALLGLPQEELPLGSDESPIGPAVATTQPSGDESSDDETSEQGD